MEYSDVIFSLGSTKCGCSAVPPFAAEAETRAITRGARRRMGFRNSSATASFFGRFAVVLALVQRFKAGACIAVYPRLARPVDPARLHSGGIRREDIVGDADSSGARGFSIAGDANVFQQAHARVLEDAGNGSLARPNLRSNSALGVLAGAVVLRELFLRPLSSCRSTLPPSRPFARFLFYGGDLGDGLALFQLCERLLARRRGGAWGDGHSRSPDSRQMAAVSCGPAIRRRNCFNMGKRSILATPNGDASALAIFFGRNFVRHGFRHLWGVWLYRILKPL